jgi:hypothetical protein
MHIERLRPHLLRIDLHALELSALVAAARWAMEGAKGELPEEARDQLGKVLRDYDSEVRRLNKE